MSASYRQRLDDPRHLSGCDKSDMLGRLHDFPTMLDDAWRSELTVFGLPKPTRILVGGMGGSAIAVELLAGLLAERSTLPLICIRDYRWPALADGDLLVTCSYSGETEETLSLFEAGCVSGKTIFALSAGGTLQDMAETAGRPHMPLLRKETGMAPRAALPDMLGKLMALVGHCGEDLGNRDEIVGELTAMGDACRADRPWSENEAKSLAIALGDENPVFVALAPPFRALALRMRNQFEENAKRRAMDASLPEMHHNSWIPWLGDDPLGVPVWLGESDAHPRTRLRRRMSETSLRQRSISALQLGGSGECIVARVLTSLLLGDFLSVYHALMRGVDPTPTVALDAMKRQLREIQE